MTRIGYYLGEPYEVLSEDGDGWVRARGVDDRKLKVWRMWGDQIMVEPWGRVPV